MRSPDRKAEIDINAPLGAYKFDAFLGRLTKGPELGTALPMVEDAILATYRRDVARVARLAVIRTWRDKDDLPTWASDARELLKAITELQPNLEHLIALGEDRDVATFAAETSRMLRDADGKRTAASSVVHTIEAAKGLRDWIEHVRKAFRIERAPPHSEPLPNHVAGLAVEMYKRRLGSLPPASRNSRNGWLGDFIAALWSDFRWSPPDGKDNADLPDYFGRKVESAVVSARAGASAT
jgi:hypothetical protein